MTQVDLANQEDNYADHFTKYSYFHVGSPCFRLGDLSEAPHLL